MATTVQSGFNEFHKKLTPTLKESEAAKNHRNSIKSALESKYGIWNFFRTGSFGNGTSIRGYSDVDYFANIPPSKMNTNSTYALREVREVLNNRFPQTGVSVRTPGVLVPFGTDASESTEVIPTTSLFDDNDNLIYKIADGSGGWMLSNPRKHIEYVNEINSKGNGKVKPLIRFIKAWKYYQNVPISSFYLEMRVAKYASSNFPIIYSWDIRNIFKSLLDTKLSSMQDPQGICGYIEPCSTEKKKEESLSKLSTAYSRAKNAKDAEDNDKIMDAFSWWHLLFNYEFPHYG
ncbi:hypothetical protein MSWAN_1263 [Methanobacterium paludis]|uniref:protein adenylyltransferase n=2 Tax=Methanobacterium paludis (strain DSM 25820 / JCM 18151 / SWAN1) TaxID=868131 RepID=F6D667_METPW|nr:hypothetical protein MSWAN_1263 [Methanobacterium paludis]